MRFNSIKFYLNTGLMFIIVTSVVLHAEITYNESWQGKNVWKWTATIADINIKENGNRSNIQTDLSKTSLTDRPVVPYYYKIIYAKPEKINVNISTSANRKKRLVKPIQLFSDQGVGDTTRLVTSSENTQYPSIFPDKQVKTKFLGEQNGVPLTGVYIYPIQVIQQGKVLSYSQKITVSISVETDGSAPLSSSLPPIVRNLSNSRAFQKSEDNPRPLSKTNSSEIPKNRPLIKLVVNQDGIYRIYREALVDSLKEFKDDIKSLDPRTFQAFNKGNNVPIFVHGEEDGQFDKGDYIEFVGRRNPNHLSESYYHPYTDNNVYWLSWGTEDGLRYSTESAEPSVSHDRSIIPREFQYTKHIEENNSFVKLSKIATDMPVYKKDHWFFDSGIKTGMTRVFRFTLDHPDEYTADNFSVRARFHGLTYTGNGHNVTLYINDRLVANGEWYGQTPHIIESKQDNNLQNNFLRHGENNIQIAMTKNYTGDTFDKILFDWLEIEYTRKYSAAQNFIEFTPPSKYPEGIYHFPVENFSSPDISVYKLGTSKLTGFDVEHNTSQDRFSIIIEDNVDNDTRYFAACQDGIKSPLSIQADTLTGLNNSNENCDVIVISPEKWNGSLNRLTDFYQEEGLVPQVFNLEDIYNEFNNGIASPFGIKNFLTYASENWSSNFNYVLLVGDAEMRAENSVIPAFFYQTYKFGASACDYWYSIKDEDVPIPQFSIGRWPCNTKEELELLIDKRIEHKKSREIKAPWHNEIMFIAGYEDAFKIQSDYIIKRHIPKEVNPNRIFINPSSQNTPYWGGSDSLINQFNSGLATINFYGHGGGAVWADKGLFTTDHLPLLDNRDRLPFITSMTCFTGDFANMTGLGEYLLLLENGGTIGLLGASSVGWIKNDYLLSTEIYEQLFKPGMRVGDAINIGKIVYFTANDYFSYLKKSMVYTYNLLGDPTVQLPTARSSLNLTTNKSDPAPGENVKLSGTLPFDNGQGYLNLYNPGKYKIPINPSHYQIDKNQFETEILLPDTISTEELYFNYYFHNSEYDEGAAGYTAFNIRGEEFYGFENIPEEPRKNEETQFHININHDDIQNIFCLIDTANVYAYLDENGIEHISSFQSSANTDTLEMHYSSEKAAYSLKEPFTSSTPGRLIALKFMAVSSQGRTTESVVYTIQIKREPDLRISDIQQVYQNFPGLLAIVQSSSQDTIKNVKLNITDEDDRIFGSDNFNILPNIDNELFVPGILGEGQRKFVAEIDPQNDIIESNESNNISDTISIGINTFPILPDFGSSYSGQENDTIEFDDTFSIYFPPGSVTDSAAIKIRSVSINIDNNSQPDFSVLPIGSTYCYQVEISESELAKDFHVEFNGLSDTLTNNGSLSRWSDDLRLWLTSQNFSGELAGDFSQSGKFAVINSQDNISPNLELSVDGKQFFDASYISQRPNISIIGEDKNGVKFTSDGLKVFLDNDQVQFDDFNIPDTIPSGNYVTAQFRPTLEYGDHSLKVILEDASGNQTENEIIFTVSDRLQLRDYGNFPNPFKRQTTFIYELSKRVDKLKIKIYTVSGKLIKTIDNTSYFSSGTDLRNSGYHEVTWDGMDRNGNYLANGVYFYKIYVKKDDKTKTSIGKIAKSR